MEQGRPGTGPSELSVGFRTVSMLTPNRMQLRLRSALILILLCAVGSKFYVKYDAGRRHELEGADWSARLHFRQMRWPKIVRTEAYFRDGRLFVLAWDEDHHETRMEVNRYMGEVTVVYRVLLSE